eukprot:jgi/Undpi1/8220/HiC_scaffold_25.g10690.m1
MRLAGFAMEKAKPDATAGATAAAAAAAAAVAGESEGGRADYAWVSREPTSALHINMLECFGRALEEHVVPRAASTTAAAVAMAGADTRGGGSRAAPQEDAANMTKALQLLAIGSQPTPSAEESDFSRLRKQQDKEFQDALKADMESKASAAAAKASATTTAAAADARPLLRDTQSDGGGRRVVGVADGGGDAEESSSKETAQERRAKIAASYARVGLGA